MAVGAAIADIVDQTNLRIALGQRARGVRSQEVLHLPHHSAPVSKVALVVAVGGASN